MKNFILAALPWICIGITIALCAMNFSKRTKAKKENEELESYMLEGMCIGMCIGSAINTAYISYGMLLGLVAGMCIKKVKKENKE